MQLQFLGAAKEVTGSKHLLTVNGKRVLLDCGLFQGHRKEADTKNRQILIDPKQVDAMIISHAHMDHIGLIPYYVNNGFDGPIYCTDATRDLASYMLMDSAFIQMREVEWLMKKGKSYVPPLYTEDDIAPVLQNMVTLGYHRTTEIFKGLKLTYYDAGHILGSAMIQLEILEDGAKEPVILTFTGDLGRRGLPILRDPEYIPYSDYLICESTYGNRFHKFIHDVDKHFKELVNKVIKRGGKIIIPAFALERTQEVVFHLNNLMKNKEIPEVPIYVDSPLAVNLCDVFARHPECFDKEINQEFVRNFKNPFGFGQLRYVGSVEESKSLNAMTEPMIIISASGMCEFGRVLHHLKNNITDPRNMVLIVGYQAENTLGRKLLNKDETVKIFGDTYPLNADVEVIDAFSGHADRTDLIDFVGHIDGLKKTFIVHGEENQGLTFAEILKQNHQDLVVETPSLGDVFEI